MNDQGAEPVFDEEVSLRRFHLALRRSDERLFEQALLRLDAELGSKAKFSRTDAWLEFVRAADAKAGLSEELKRRVRLAITRVVGPLPENPHQSAQPVSEPKRVRMSLPLALAAESAPPRVASPSVAESAAQTVTVPGLVAAPAAADAEQRAAALLAAEASQTVEAERTAEAARIAEAARTAEEAFVMEVDLADMPWVAGGAPPPKPPEGTVAIIAAWHGGLADARVVAAFRRALANGREATAARALLLRWLAEGLGLGAIARRAQLAVAAAAGGLALAEPGWVETFYAALWQAVDVPAEPLYPGLGGAIASLSGVAIITADPGPAWAREPVLSASSPPTVLALNGSLETFACPRCPRITRVPRAEAAILVVACASCSTPAYPQVSPFEDSALLPGASRGTREQTAGWLERAQTWILVDPPAAADDPILAWLLARLGPGKRIGLVGSAHELDAESWVTRLEPYRPAQVLPALGRLDEVLFSLLSSGEGAETDATPTAGRKRGRRG